MDFLISKHHNKAFIVLLSDSRHSQLHFGTKMNFLGACVADLRLNFAASGKTGFSLKEPEIYIW